MNNTKRKGFTLIELVIVVAIIGILALMIIPQFNQITQDAKDKEWEGNCQTVVSAIAMYQAGHNGDMPSGSGDLNPYINGGWNAVTGPSGATYTYSAGKFTSKYTDYKKGGTMPTSGPYKGGEFAYPSSGN